MLISLVTKKIKDILIEADGKSGKDVNTENEKSKTIP
jgi:hypothetical protein